MKVGKNLFEIKMKLTKYENGILNKFRYINKLSFDEIISLINDVDVSLINSNIQEYVNYVNEQTLDLKKLEDISLIIKKSEEIDCEIFIKNMIFIENIIIKYSKLFVTRKNIINVIPKGNPIIEYALHLKESHFEYFIDKN